MRQTPFKTILELRVKVKYVGNELTSKDNMVRSIVPDYPITVEVENDEGALCGKLTVELETSCIGLPGRPAYWYIKPQRRRSTRMSGKQ